ncbi:MAG: DUF2207 domain-containing protein [Verrucomicrobiales bacterium]|nr:DUF2207 domain-containing protein [Verrucomicrobiales bacterium]
MTRQAVTTFFTYILALLSTLAAQQGETISNYDVRLEIDPQDASLFVTETITVSVRGDRIKHGIYRDFPTLNKGAFGFRRPVGFDVISALRNGERENFTIEGLKDGKRVRIGNPGKKLEHGTHTYTLDYRTTGQLRSFSARDELYWNATGHFWDFSISNAKVTVVLPDGAEIIVDDDIRPAAYIGRPGGGENPADYTYSQEREHTAIFTSHLPILPGEGITVAVPFTKGTVRYPPADNFAFLKENWATILGMLIVAAAIAFQIGAWVAVGKDPDPGLVHTRIEPPEGFSPAACRYLKNMGYDNKCFAAAVVGLASKNALRITGDPDTGFILRHPDSSLEKAPLTKDEAALAKELLHNRESLALEQTSHHQISSARDTLKSELAGLLEKTHFVRNLHLWVPGLLATLVGVGLSLFNSALPPVAFFLAVWLTIWTAGCAFLLSSALGAFREKRWGPAFGFSLFSLPFLAGWVAGFWFFSETASTTTILLLVAGFAVNFLFYHLIKAPTHAGRDVLDDIEGFEKYLDDAGSDTSTSNVETFSRYLAYAIALDREEMLGDRFAAALADASSPASSALPTHHPHWYTGNIAASAFASSIGSSLTTSLASSAQSPSSSSGSSGGGSSGGGGGGGGGGGW